MWNNDNGSVVGVWIRVLLIDRKKSLINMNVNKNRCVKTVMWMYRVCVCVFRCLCLLSGVQDWCRLLMFFRTVDECLMCLYNYCQMSFRDLASHGKISSLRDGNNQSCLVTIFVYFFSESFCVAFCFSCWPHARSYLTLLSAYLMLISRLPNFYLVLRWTSWE